MPNKTSYSIEHAGEDDTMDSDDSGSAYEASSDELPSSPEITSRSKVKTSTNQSNQNSPRIKTADEVLKDAAEWAARFQAPLSPGDIPAPSRKPARARPRVKRKSRKQAPNEVRAKRLKQYYNDDYRLLLNDTIQDAASNIIEEGHAPLGASQIGSSVWTSTEKDVFFHALGRLDRDDLRGIAGKIETKSEVEVHDYILHLDLGVRERHAKGAKFLQLAEFPAVLEVSDECCAVLERAGDAITARQEVAAENVEREKWGDSWLLTKDVSRWIEKRMRQKGGEDEIQEVLPAAKLLSLGNWLELSREVFMNPGPSREEDNWKNIAEEGETPAIRATAFEDFHSLTVSITKRLLSTVLFCTMSRLRARDSHVVKHAEVRPDDVEAAVNILGLKSNSNEFWIKAARRCNLAVVDDENADDEDEDDEENEEPGEEEENSDSTSDQEDIYMTYSAIETNLVTTTRRSRSRSRSVSRPPRTPGPIETLPTHISSPEDYTSPESESDIYSSADEEHPLSGSGRSASRKSSSRESVQAERLEALEDEQDAHAEIIDMHASRMDEVQLWSMLKQTAPFEIDIQPIADLERPKPLPVDIEGRTWRDHMEFVSQWETQEAPVPEAAFAQNKRRLSRLGKRKASIAFSETKEQSGKDLGNDGRALEEMETGGVESQYDEDSDGGEEVEVGGEATEQNQDAGYANTHSSTGDRSQSDQSDEMLSPRRFQSPPEQWGFQEEDEY